MDYTLEASVAAASVAGLYVSCALRGSSSPLSWSQIAMVAGASAASCVVAPTLSRAVVCPHSPVAPVIEASASAGTTWLALYTLGADSESATMFIPVQVGAYFVGQYTARYMRAMSAPKEPQMEEGSVDGVELQ